ncbi:hypothetical protein [Paenibacillus alvei]|uniref:hypothetical protein n=1 Tax=Paenibacillus alvei TaxID=44250 RepID=UPI0022806021|nr:hypothetical protein [Paenibacillus alvei]
MNWKPVEMQIAIPRTQESSTLQHQQQQRPVTEQAMLNDQAQRLMEKSRERNAQVESSQDARIRNQHHEGGNHAERDGSDNSHSEQKQDETEQVMVPAQHPFKGKHIDFMC